MADAGLSEIERWFLARGIPHFIADYDNETRVWTRATPFLLVTYLLAAVPVAADSWGAAGIEFAVSMGGVVAAWVVLNLIRRQAPFARPRRVGRFELAIYVVGPALGHVILGDPGIAALVAAVQLVLLGFAYVFTSYALFPLLRWTVKRSFDSLRAAGVAMARALPLLLLLVVTFFFLTAEVWQVFARLQGIPYGLTLVLFLVAGAAFVARRARSELAVERIDDADELRDLVEGTPAAAQLRAAGQAALEAVDTTLTRRQRINLLLVIVINQVLLAIVVAAAIGAFFLVFGFFAIGADVVEAWVLHPPHSLWSIELSGRTLMLSEELVRVTGFLATFCGFYFGVQSATDPTLREGLDDFAEDNLRQLFAMRQVYLASRGAG